MSMPLVSVIVPCYNAAPYLAEALRSIQGQTHAAWEMVVVDDGSTDCSAEIALDVMRGDPRCKVVRTANAGVCAARNRGFRETSQDSSYLYFLDADDRAEPAMLATLLDRLERKPQAAMAYCNHGYIGEHGSLLRASHREMGFTPRVFPKGLGVGVMPDQDEDTPYSTVFVASIVPSMCVIRRAAYELTPGWDEEFGRPFEDTLLILQIALHGTVIFVPDALVLYRRHSSQYSSGAGHRWYKQCEKMYSRMRSLDGLSAEQRAMLLKAFWFREGRVIPIRGIRSGLRQLRSGNLVSAVRFIGGALRRYRLSAAGTRRLKVRAGVHAGLRAH